MATTTNPIDADRLLGDRLRAVAGLLGRGDVAFAVLGAAGGQAHGLGRPTRDIDLMVSPAGFAALVAHEPRHRFLPPNGLRVDGRDTWLEVWRTPLVLLGQDRAYAFTFDSAMLARRRARSVCGSTVPVLGLEDLLAFKLLHWRGPEVGKSDRTDVRVLATGHRSGLDLAYLRWRLRRCAAGPEVLAVLDGLLAVPGPSENDGAA